MNHAQSPKNLWIVWAGTPGASFIHREDLATGAFDPIYLLSQAVDPVQHSGVIPLRGPSC